MSGKKRKPSAINKKEASSEGINECKQKIKDLIEEIEEVSSKETVYNTILSSITDGVILYNKKGSSIYANDTAKRVFGYDPSIKDRSKTISLLQFQHPNGSPVTLDELPSSRALKGQFVINEELSIKSAEGKRISILTSAAPTFTRGFFSGAVVIWHDITERKRAEEMILTSEKRYHSLFENMLDGYAYCKMLYDDKGKAVDFIYLDVNKSFYRLTGLKDVKQKKVSEVIPGIRKANPELFQIYGKVVKSGKPTSFETYIESLELWLSISVYRQKKEHFVAVFDNITERKRTEEKLTMAKQRLEAHISNSPLANIEFDSDFNVIRWSKEAERLFGWKSDEILGRAISEIQWVYKDDEELVKKESAGFIDGSTPRHLNVNRNYRKNGSVIWCEWYNSAIYDNKGKLISVFSQVLDITERKRAEESLRESEQRFRRIFEEGPLGIILLDKDRRFIDVNPTFAKILGYDRKEIIGKTFAEFTHPEDLETSQQEARKILTGEAPVVKFEKRYIRKNGSIIWVRLTSTVIKDERGNILYLLAMFEDVTEKRKND